MKKKITKETTFCDICGKEEYVERCLLCGLEMCYKCREKKGKQYNHAVYFQGSGDGYYCTPCDAKLKYHGTDKLHNAYRAIKSLRDELNDWGKDFKNRQEAAENALKKLLP